MTEAGPITTYTQNRPLDTVPEWSTHSDSPDSYVGPKTPSVSSHADPTMLSTDPVKPKDTPQILPVESIFASLKSAIRRVHPDQQDQQRVVITRASTATSRGSDPQGNHPFLPIPTIPERTLLSPGSASSVRTTQTNDSVSSFATQRTMSMSSALSVIPLTDDGLSDSSNDGILMKGRLLCAIHMDWYSRRMSANETSYNHVRLRKSRLRWREFEAVLKADRMELYLVTNLVIKTRRLAHVIYLDSDALRKRKSKAYNPVRLALVSPLDFIWSLQFRSCEGRNVHFLFAARTIRESQLWYMACYHRPTTKTTPIPALIDLYIPALDNLQIRLPLADLDFQCSNVRVYHVIQCILNILDRQGIKPDDWRYDNVSLCWCYEKKPLPEWIPDNGYLMSPHLIEQVCISPNR
ncbi:hypothetical protein BJV82DRAFT_257555 [Fennellomyces sp. T-0311]|nr:hypothetical protein BJV82DRAFT_257555 [Fennellomyces sp. T-0311]